MSTAFRNFIITFALAAVLFAVVSYVAVNGVLTGLFSGGEDTSEEEVEYSYANAESYYDGEFDGSDEDIPSTEEFGDAVVVFYEDHTGELKEIKLICANDHTGKLVYETIPLNSTLVVNGYNRSVKEVWNNNGYQFLCGKLQYVLGVMIKGYTVFDPESMYRLFAETDLITKNQLEVKCILPYEIKYEDPEMKEYNEQNPDDIQYITLLGEAVIIPEIADTLFHDIPEDSYDSKAASEMFMQIYKGTFETLFKCVDFKNNADDIAELFKCFENSTVKKENQKIFAGLYDETFEVLGFHELASSDGKELNWSVLPVALESLLK